MTRHAPGLLAAIVLCSSAAVADDAATRARIGRDGGTLRIGRHIDLTVPAGLPTGEREFTFAIVDERPAGREVARGFVPVGPTLGFDGAIDATERPIVVRVRARRIPARRPGHRYVVAVEHADLCREGESQRRIAEGLCTSWRVHAAERRPGELRAELPTTGGMRIQFGLGAASLDPS